MPDYPAMIAQTNQMEAVPRRIRAVLNGQTVLDTDRAVYLWEWSNYPQYYVPVADIRPDVLIDENREQKLSRGCTRRHGLRVGDADRPGAVRVYTADSLPGLDGLARIDWDAVDAWYEEDEQVYVHPRNPYVRVDALRSTRPVRVELDGVLLAESSSPVLVFETGLPTRYYLNPTEVDLSHLERTDTQSECPYKGTTTQYWSVRIGDTLHDDLAWSYDFPTRQLLPIAGLIAFYNEKVDISRGGVALERPVTHFFQ